MRRHLAVQVPLPVEALGDGLDHQIALREQRQMLIVIGRLDQRGRVPSGERRGLQFLQPLDGLSGDSVLVAFLRRQIEEDGRHARVDEVRCDLSAHHPGAEHGRLADVESILRHGVPSKLS